MIGASCLIAGGCRGSRGPVRRRSGWAALAVLTAVLYGSSGALAAIGPGERSGGVAAVSGDGAATRVLLAADYRLAKEILARVVPFGAAQARAARALGRECKGVLRGGPDGAVIEEEGPLASSPTLSGRAQGERARSEREEQTIDSEIEETTFAAVYRVLRGPYEAYIAATDRLTWSNPTVNALVDQRAVELREELAGPSVSVCREMRVWAASGFHVLPPGSKRLEESREARSTQTPKGDLGALLGPYEGPAARAILRRIRVVNKTLTEKELAGEGFSRAQADMELALGEKLSRSAEQKLAPVIGKGRTSATPARGSV
jgi:hypothetical protein